LIDTHEPALPDERVDLLLLSPGRHRDVAIAIVALASCRVAGNDGRALV
jgi:hypothetical protein